MSTDLGPVQGTAAAPSLGTGSFHGGEDGVLSQAAVSSPAPAGTAFRNVCR